MGGLYNAFFGTNPQAPYLLGFLGVLPREFGRFRDAFVAQGEIVVYTRCGGDNRPDYADVFERMKQHPNFLRDADDTFDSTYCTFYFRIPDDKQHILAPMDIGPWEPDKRWKEAIDKFATDTTEAERVITNAHDYVRVLGNDGKMHSLDKLADLLKKGNDK